MDRKSRAPSRVQESGRQLPPLQESGQASGRQSGTASQPCFLRFPSSRFRPALNCRAAVRQARNRLRIMLKAGHKPLQAIV
ncbi:MAG: hypothetical protein P9E24_02930 [Candidatus Competibacter sp.]|nr:hypothetical protein [Candidatus Competibacter sp.]MDG4583173.1 hypothetical protein [Candidatus Competibacter sp.]